MRGPRSPTPRGQVSDYATAFHRLFTRDPNACVALGVDRHLDELPDPSLATADRDAADMRALAEQIAAEPADGFDDELDRDLARLELLRHAHGLTRETNGRELARRPTASHDVGDGIFLIFANDPRPAAERLEDITKRLQAVPDYVEALLGRLERPVSRWVEMDVEAVGGLPSLFESIEGWARDEGWDGVPRLAAARERADAALASYCTELRTLEHGPDFHLGRAGAEELIDLRGIPLTPEELRGIATDFLAATVAATEELGAKLIEKYGLDADSTPLDVQHHLKQRYRVAVDPGNLEGVLDHYQAERDRVLAFIRERDLFPVPDDQDMCIMRTPPFMEPSTPAGAMMQPPPFREGVRRSMVYLTLSEELLAEHTEVDIPLMIVHEGIPGHHLQLSTACRHPSFVRRHVSAMDHAEGWTTMLEDYMLDVGYREDLADEIRFTAKREIARIGARVGIDLFFMTGDEQFLDVGVDCDRSSDDPFEAAGSLLAAVTGFVPGRVQAELNWYSTERSYPLCYLAGNHLVWNLKRDLERSPSGPGPGLELDRAFHRVYLESGNMPVSRLRRVFEHRGMLP